MESIRTTLEIVLAALTGQSKVAPYEKLDAELKKILTKKELSHIKVHNFRNGVVTVGVDSSAWMYHLNLQKSSVLLKLQKANIEIKDMRFFIGDSECQKKNQSRKTQ